MLNLVITNRVFTQLEDINFYISTEASVATADQFIEGLLDRCQQLRRFPKLGVSRNDIRPGLRLFTYRKHVTIAYEVEADQITILYFLYAGRDINTFFEE